ncbi:hypothetical protein PVAND_001364 [Polypedilum vanderplanki]|uniref:Peptidase C1A papain C-terminal domain-containing protein n=1 Tax=Polypedilum vanderplanki TaxID=319348 RepID=A0A9J6BN88_POLVA|nr:hypothetical protein PVAND_001364 [Polypedilum vanderplanki]
MPENKAQMSLFFSAFSTLPITTISEKAFLRGSSSTNNKEPLTIPPLNYPLYNYTTFNVPPRVDWNILMEPVQNQGLCGESNEDGNVAPKTDEYPYQMKKNNCKKSVQLNLTKVIQKFTNGNESLLQAQVTNYGPTIGVFYVIHSFLTLGNGVFKDSTCPTGTLACNVVQHSILIVGYGTDEIEGNHWLVKNSWGISWGQNGYGRIARNQNNMCGLLGNQCFLMI